MTGFLLDLRYAVRLWLKHRTFVTAAITTIAVAIAANTTIFSIVYGALLKPLNLPHPDRVVRIEERHQGRRLNLTGATFVDLHDRTRLLEAVAAYRIRSVGLYGREGAPMQLTAAEVSADYFQVLGRPPARGRWFTPDDLRTGAPRSVVVSESVAKRIFGGADDVVSRAIVIDAVPAQIVGIAPAGLFVPGSPDVWLPQDSSSPLLRNRRAHLFTTIARLRETATFRSMTQEVTSLASSIEHDAGRVDPDMVLTAESLQTRMVESIRPALLMLWVAVGLVLLIAAANIANLLLMQGVSRSREVSIRVALGAARSRVARQIATECLLLACVGGALGTALSLWSLPVLRTVLPASIPRVEDVSSSAPVVLFGISVSVLMAVLFGLAPAMRGPMHVPIDALRARATRGRSQSFARSVLVGVEVAFTVILLTGAVLLGRSLWAILQIDLGYNPSGVVAFRLSLPSATYPDAAAHNAFYSRVLERIAELPEVSAAGVTGALPLTGTPATTMEPEPIRVGEQLSADVITASPGFFESLNVPLRQGRVFTERDVKGTQPVVIINEAAARRFWPGMNPLGRSVTMKDWGLPYRAEVIGIVGNIRQAGADVESSPAVYYPLAQFPEMTLSEAIVVRVGANVSPVIAEVQNQVWAIDPRQPIGWIRTMDEISAASTSERRFNMVLIASFAAAGLLLSALGIYGIVAFAVAERAHEFAVRIALGAPRSDLLRVLMAHGAGPVAIGLCVGLAGAAIASRLLETLLFGVRPTDPVTLVGVTVTIACVTVLACAAPLRRAIRLDPMAALRIE